MFKVPKFSIVLTTYNRMSLIERAILSVIHQTEKSWELLIIDDGSTDDTAKVVLPYLEKEATVFYFRQKNMGEVYAKNRGISLSCGAYITFIDSDDTYKPKHLEHRKQILNQHPEIDFLYGGVEIWGDEYVPDRNKEGKYIHLSNCIIGGTFFVKREALFALGGFDKLDIGADADLYDRAILANLNIMKTNYPSYIYNRKDNNSITHNYPNNKNEKV